MDRSPGHRSTVDDEVPSPEGGPDGTGLTAEGSVDGYISPTRAGDRGFGYDPVFEPAEGDGRTFSEMTIEEKHELSHRSRALAALDTALSQSPPPGLT